jgi:hypothetical protein
MTSPDLIRQLQATRPEASASLRERVRALGEQERERPARIRFPSLTLRRPALVALPVATVLALGIGAAGVVGLTDSGGDRDAVQLQTTNAAQPSERTPILPPPKAQPLEGAPASGATDQAQPFSTHGATVAPDGERAQRVTATLTVKVTDSAGVSRAAQEALDLTRSLGGHVVSASVNTGDDASASLTLRIPVARTEDAIVRLSALGTIVAQQVSMEDLQETIDAFVRRARNAQEQIVRITARLESESLSAGERAALELRRKNLRAQLRSYRGSISATQAQGRFATLQVTVVTPDSLGAVPTPSRLDRTLDRALEILVWEGVITLAVLLVAAPFAILGLAAFVVRQVYRKREDERLLAAS